MCCLNLVLQILVKATFIAAMQFSGEDTFKLPGEDAGMRGRFIRRENLDSMKIHAAETLSPALDPSVDFIVLEIGLLKFIILKFVCVRGSRRFGTVLR